MSLFPNSASTLIFVLPALPFLVLIIITPFAAREPYIDAAEASFNTEMVSISLGLRLARRLLEFVRLLASPVLTGIPSMTKSGAEDAVIEPMPRIRICWA
jgi:hypothetical protein